VNSRCKVGGVRDEARQTGSNNQMTTKLYYSPKVHPYCKFQSARRKRHDLIFFVFFVFFSNRATAACDNLARRQHCKATTSQGDKGKIYLGNLHVFRKNGEEDHLCWVSVCILGSCISFTRTPRTSIWQGAPFPLCRHQVRARLSLCPLSLSLSLSLVIRDAIRHCYVERGRHADSSTDHPPRRIGTQENLSELTGQEDASAS
jgi:hypothetical protein